jgi:hypothetical protein
MKKIFAVLVLAITTMSVDAMAKKAAASKLSYISMHRGACFGQCPDYTIELYSNGLVRYTGRYFAENKGTYEKNIGTTKAAVILKSVDKYRIDTCKKDYDNNIPDLPGISYKMVYKGKEKAINNAHFGPDILKELANELDAKVGKPDKTWRKTKEFKEQ